MKLFTAGFLSALIVVGSKGQKSDPLDIYRQYHACSICSNGKEPALEALGLLHHGSNHTQDSLTCEEAQAKAQMGRLSPASCLLLRLRVLGDCVCEAPDPNFALAAEESTADTPDAVVASPAIDLTTSLTRSSAAENTTDPPATASSPVIDLAAIFALALDLASMQNTTETTPELEATLAPSSLPDAASAPVIDLAATLAPSSAIIEQQSETSTSFSTSVLITPVAGSFLTQDQLIAFEGTMENFLEGSIEDINNLKCKVTDQNSSNSRIVSAVEVIVSCHTESTKLSTEEFSVLATNVVENMAGALLDDLRENPDFHHQIATLFNFDGTEYEADDDDDELVERKRWVLFFAAAFPITGLIGLCSLLVFLVVRKAIKAKRSENREYGTVQDSPSRPSGFSFLSTPIAAAVSIAALGRRSSDPSTKKVGFAIEKEDASLMTIGTGTMSCHRSNFSSRTVWAPEGKLGIVIDTTLEGPVVHTVKLNSPLLGLLFAGDLIVAVNNEDTRTMSAIGLTDLMSRTSNIPRELVVLSRDVVG